ncbi:MAG: HRDC domain-containing protein [Bacteroidales bacterium]|nr:HRDC domain-containing protein [Bacteroidales bacterium]MCM1414686.1 HRDC domain-containing protein [bacterium]MCM1422495.1 HRDC domain-containing protein [bacterium]
MGIFTKSIGPVFLKEASDADTYIAKLQDLLSQTPKEHKRQIQKQLNIANAGKYGESNIAFELKNSGMDMYILHDIYLEYGDLSAQIDYLVITKKHIYVIECKNLIGNIDIDHTGAFIRKYEISGKPIKEGIYSPVTQNQRHLQVLKEIRKNSKSNFFSKMLFERFFEDTYQSIVVLANPKTYLNAKYAPKEIKSQVIRADQLIAYIRKKDHEAKDEMNNETMRQLANFYLEQHRPSKSDYAQKYEKLLQDINSQTSVPEEDPIENYKENILQRLREYRLNQSKAEGIKPFYIFNDAQMQDLAEKMPRTKEALLQVSGFGNIKVEKYGEDIIQILWCP